MSSTNHLLDAAQDAKRRLVLHDWLGRRGVTVKRSGPHWKALCPFHGDTDPSLHLYDDHYHCFVCEAHGDHITWLREHEGLSWVSAVELLASEAGVVIPEAADRKRAPPGRRQRLFEVNAVAAQWFFDQLADSQAAQAYLRERGLTDDTAIAFGIGYSPPRWTALTEHLTRQGMLEEAKELGLVTPTKRGVGFRDFFPGRIMFPLRTPAGEIAGFSGRYFEGGDPEKAPKYLNSKPSAVFTKGELLFGYHRARRAAWKAKSVVLVEGNLDVCALQQAGFVNAVGTCGTALTADQGDLLRRAAPAVVLMNDPDKAGRAAAVRQAQELLLLDFERVDVVELPEGQDPAALLATAGGLEELQRRVASARDGVEVVTRAALAGRPDDAQGRLAAVRELQPWLVGMEVAKRELLLAGVARVLGVEVALARQWLGSSRLRLSHDGRARILVTEDVAAVERELDAALVELAHDLYRRDGMVQQMVVEDGKTTTKPLTAWAFWALCGRYVIFEDVSSKGETRQRTPPKEIIQGYQTGHAQGLRRLAAIVDVPFFRPDGSICTDPGYDAATQTFLAPCLAMDPPLPSHPTRADAEEALGVLLELTASFQVATEIDRAAMVAAFLTPIARPLCPSVPAFWCDGTVPESGKTEIARIASWMREGRPPDPTSGQNLADPDKIKPELQARIISGTSVLLWDNLPNGSVFGTSWLCSWLTESRIAYRPLYSTVDSHAPQVSTLYYTGNNLQLGEDMSSRTVRVRLVGKPHKGSKPPHWLVRDNRWRYLRAALVLLRAFRLSGATGLVEHDNRFHEWHQTVRASLVWLGYADPWGNAGELVAEDHVRQAHLDILKAWWALYKDEAKRVAEVVKDVEQSKTDEATNLRSSLTELLGDKRPNEKSLGLMLRRIGNGVTHERMTLRRSMNHAGQRMWQVTMVGAAA